ncbi:transposase [Streptomyces spiralis]|uniref:transposase n=1 Tax=Streptomyces spiralis TaxID=66376 RepID=UPI00367EF545
MRPQGCSVQDRRLSSTRSDRQAAEAVRCRLDFTYAPAVEPDDPGFHHSVPADFRERLTHGGRADRLLDLALARLKEAGPVRERTTQRTDSTHVIAAARDLTRLELITEAVRAALEEVARTAGHLLVGLVDEEWGRRYGRPVRLGKNLILAAGDDACRLLEHLRYAGRSTWRASGAERPSAGGAASGRLGAAPLCCGVSAGRARPASACPRPRRVRPPHRRGS